jgi:hypothetical protein
MSADPITTGLIISAAASSVSTGLGMKANRQQQKIELAMLEAETESAKLQASEEAFESARSFRQALASQLAISSLRSGTGGSLVRQFGAASISNMLRDQEVFGRRQKFIDIAASSSRAQIKSNRFSKDISGLGGLLEAGVSSLNFSQLRKEVQK